MKVPFKVYNIVKSKVDRYKIWVITLYSITNIRDWGLGS